MNDTVDSEPGAGSGADGEAALAAAVPNAALRVALLESRQRWRQFAALAADMMFEADAAGRLTFVAPDGVLGWPAQSLLGQPGHVLLHDQAGERTEGGAGPDPFRFTTAIRRRHTWMRTMAGVPVCMALTLVPLRDEAGQHRGVRGVAVNVTAQELAEAETASALRRGQAVDRILGEMRQEILAPKMMRAVLDGVTRALGAQGTAVLDISAGEPWLIKHQAGEDAAPILLELAEMVVQGADTAMTLMTSRARPVILCPASTRFGEAATLLVFREPGGRAWDADDVVLAGSVTGLTRIVLEHEAIQRELTRQARTDPLTGLLNRRAFLEEATRRLDRLEAEGRPASLLFIDLDGLKQLNDSAGHEAGDAALTLTSALLRRTFRPTDLIARLGGDEFACWLDGADTLTAAERAESLRLTMPNELAHLTAGQTGGVSMSIGIAMRTAGSDETLEHLLQRADQAMYDVKRNGRGHWRVSNVSWVR